MKRIIAGILIFVIAISLVSCGKKQPDPIELVLNQQNSIETSLDFKLIKISSGEKLYDSMGEYHYSKDDGNLYVDAVFDIKNTSSEELQWDLYDENPIKAFAENFDGTLFENVLVAFENNQYTNLNDYGSVAPQAESRMHIAITVPKTETDLTLNFDFYGNLYCYSYTVGTEVGEKSEMKVGEAIEIEDQGKYILSGVEIADGIRPSKADADSSLRYEVDDSSNTYIIAKFEIMNLGGSAKDVDEFFNIRVKYMDKYEYTGFVVAEEDDGLGFNSYLNIDPLSTRIVAALIEVPKSVATEMAEISIFISGTEYHYTHVPA